MTTRDYHLAQAIEQAFTEPMSAKQLSGRVRYATLAELADLAEFVRLFEHVLAFDDTGLTMITERNHDDEID